MALLRLHTYVGEDVFMREAERAIKLFSGLMLQQPMGFVHMLEAVDLYLRGATEVVLAGRRGAPEFDEWIERLGLLYVPNLALFAVDDDEAAQGGFVPEPARGKHQLDGKLTAYLCRERVCTPPITSFRELESELTAVSG